MERKSYLYQHYTWPELGQIVKQQPVVVLPIGSVEDHGRHLPLDTDNDLLVINDSITPAVGQITHLAGRIFGPTGQAIRNAIVEIWQVDKNGAYLHSKSGNREKRDPNFQGFGRFLTGSTGEYLFRTIKPVPYPGRTPHIHFAIKARGHEKFTTQCYIKGEPGNES